MKEMNWIIFLCAITLPLSQTADLCTKDAGCDPPPSSKIELLTEEPLGEKYYDSPGPILLRCETSLDVKSVLWIRNNSDGESRTLDSKEFKDKFPFPIVGNSKVAKLEDKPPEDKFPYSYECIAFGKCCDEVRSLPKTVSPRPTYYIMSISTEMPVYRGIGLVRILCHGAGDNYTRVHWIRTSQNGKNVTLNATNFNIHQDGVWQARLEYRPDYKTYTYYCVAENKCCGQITSTPLVIPFVPLQKCPDDTFKRIPINPFPSKRSVLFSWSHNHDPEDVGVALQVTGVTSEKRLNITVQEYAVHGLVPNRRYAFTYKVIFAIPLQNGSLIECQSFTAVRFFKTLPDVPSPPRNVTLVAKGNTLNVLWQRPKYENSDSIHYVIFWRRIGSNEYQHENATASPFLINNLTGYTWYNVKVHAANHIGIGNSSEEVSATTQKGPGPYIRIEKISSPLESRNYTGFGKVAISCTGEGDNRTHISWIRTEKDGENDTLKTTMISFTGENPKQWEAHLLDRPETDDFPHKYTCVVENNCCPTKMSSPIILTYSPVPDGDCPSSVVIKPIDANVVPRRRSVQFTWKYNLDPEDRGFSFKVGSFPPVSIYDLRAREHNIRDLVPNKKYNYSFSILYGGDCKMLAKIGQFMTLPDNPGRPRNVSVVVDGTSFNISWLPPKYSNGEIIHYYLSARKIDKERYETINVKTTSYVLTGLDYSTTYSIKVLAVNNVGIGNNSNPIFVSTGPGPTGPATGQRSSSEIADGAIAGAVIAPILFLIILVIILYQMRKRSQRKDHERSVREFHSLHRSDNPLNRDILASEKVAPPIESVVLPETSDFPEEISYIVLLEDWEIAADQLKLLDKKLGGGQFGIVRQGLLTSGKGDPEVVAVKTLRDNAKESDLQDLMAEMKILKDVNKIPHPNVMKLVGGCSIEGKLHVIMEFCPGGNLRNLLIKSRVYPSEEKSSNYINLASTLNHRQLLKIAADIANGMDHLATQKFIHRDLAARNILIGEDDMAKVSDFGLARDVGGAEEYIRNNQNLLPVKWMALESLLHGRFTTASDVWSYGVLLHEIATLGEEPYINISPYNIVSHVGSGCRMPQPPQCADEVYEIMRNCWKVEPTERPTFKEIRDLLHSMLMDSEKSYINITHIVDEGPLTEKVDGQDVSIKDGSVRYTTA